MENPHDAELLEHVTHVDTAELADELAPDEPKTPVWLTALGGVLFLLLAITWLAARPGEPTQGELAAAAGSASASALSSATNPPPTVVPPPPSPPPPLPTPALGPLTSAAGSGRGSSPAPRGPKPAKGVKP